MRQCENCGWKMAPFQPRKRINERLVCAKCASDPLTGTNVIAPAQDSVLDHLPDPDGTFARRLSALTLSDDWYGDWLRSEEERVAQVMPPKGLQPDSDDIYGSDEEWRQALKSRPHAMPLPVSVHERRMRSRVLKGKPATPMATRHVVRQIVTDAMRREGHLHADHPGHGGPWAHSMPDQEFVQHLSEFHQKSLGAYADTSAAKAMHDYLHLHEPTKIPSNMPHTHGEFDHVHHPATPEGLKNHLEGSWHEVMPNPAASHAELQQLHDEAHANPNTKSVYPHKHHADGDADSLAAEPAFEEKHGLVPTQHGLTDWPGLLKHIQVAHGHQAGLPMNSVDVAKALDAHDHDHTHQSMWTHHHTQTGPVVSHDLSSLEALKDHAKTFHGQEMPEDNVQGAANLHDTWHDAAPSGGYPNGLEHSHGTSVEHEGETIPYAPHPHAKGAMLSHLALKHGQTGATADTLKGLSMAGLKVQHENLHLKPHAGYDPHHHDKTSWGQQVANNAVEQANSSAPGKENLHTPITTSQAMHHLVTHHGATPEEASGLYDIKNEHEALHSGHWPIPNPHIHNQHLPYTYSDNDKALNDALDNHLALVHDVASGGSTQAKVLHHQYMHHADQPYDTPEHSHESGDPLVTGVNNGSLKPEPKFQDQPENDALAVKKHLSDHHGMAGWNLQHMGHEEAAGLHDLLHMHEGLDHTHDVPEVSLPDPGNTSHLSAHLSNAHGASVSSQYNTPGGLAYLHSKQHSAIKPSQMPQPHSHPQGDVTPAESYEPGGAHYESVKHHMLAHGNNSWHDAWFNGQTFDSMISSHKHDHTYGDSMPGGEDEHPHEDMNAPTGWVPGKPYKPKVPKHLKAMYLPETEQGALGHLANHHGVTEIPEGQDSAAYHAALHLYDHTDEGSQRHGHVISLTHEPEKKGLPGQFQAPDNYAHPWPIVPPTTGKDDALAHLAEHHPEVGPDEYEHWKSEGGQNWLKGWHSHLHSDDAPGDYQPVNNHIHGTAPNATPVAAPAKKPEKNEHFEIPVGQHLMDEHGYTSQQMHAMDWHEFLKAHEHEHTEGDDEEIGHSHSWPAGPVTPPRKHAINPHYHDETEYPGGGPDHPLSHVWFHGARGGFHGPPVSATELYHMTGSWGNYGSGDWNCHVGPHFSGLHSFANNFGHGTVKPCHINSKNPKVYNDLNAMCHDAYDRLVSLGEIKDRDNLVGNHNDSHGYNNSSCCSSWMLKYAQGTHPDRKDGKYGLAKFRDSLRASGHDGILVRNQADSSGDWNFIPLHHSDVHVIKENCCNDPHWHTENQVKGDSGYNAESQKGWKAYQWHQQGGSDPNLPKDVSHIEERRAKGLILDRDFPKGEKGVGGGTSEDYDSDAYCSHCGSYGHDSSDEHCEDCNEYGHNGTCTHGYCPVCEYTNSHGKEYEEHHPFCDYCDNHADHSTEEHKDEWGEHPESFKDEDHCPHCGVKDKANRTESNCQNCGGVLPDWSKIKTYGKPAEGKDGGYHIHGMQFDPLSSTGNYGNQHDVALHLKHDHGSDPKFFTDSNGDLDHDAATKHHTWLHLSDDAKGIFPTFDHTHKNPAIQPETMNDGELAVHMGQHHGMSTSALGMDPKELAAQHEAAHAEDAAIPFGSNTSFGNKPYTSHDPAYASTKLKHKHSDEQYVPVVANHGDPDDLSTHLHLVHSAPQGVINNPEQAKAWHEESHLWGKPVGGYSHVHHADGDFHFIDQNTPMSTSDLDALMLKHHFLQQHGHVPAMSGLGAIYEQHLNEHAHTGVLVPHSHVHPHDVASVGPNFDLDEHLLTGHADADPDGDTSNMDGPTKNWWHHQQHGNGANDAEIGHSHGFDPSDSDKTVPYGLTQQVMSNTANHMGMTATLAKDHLEHEHGINVPISLSGSYYANHLHHAIHANPDLAKHFEGSQDISHDHEYGQSAPMLTGEAPFVQGGIHDHLLASHPTLPPSTLSSKSTVDMHTLHEQEHAAGNSHHTHAPDPNAPILPKEQYHDPLIKHLMKNHGLSKDHALNLANTGFSNMDFIKHHKDLHMGVDTPHADEPKEEETPDLSGMQVGPHPSYYSKGEAKHLNTWLPQPNAHDDVQAVLDNSETNQQAVNHLVHNHGVPKHIAESLAHPATAHDEAHEQYHTINGHQHYNHAVCVHCDRPITYSSEQGWNDHGDSGCDESPDTDDEGTGGHEPAYDTESHKEMPSG